MSEATGTGLDEARREVLNGLADVLIPAAYGMPAASEADASGRWIDRVLEARPDLGPALTRVLDAAAGRDPEAEIARLQDEDADGLEALTRAVTGAYYINQKIRKRIGYPGQKATPFYEDEAEFFLEGGLVDPVVERGAFGPQAAPAPIPRPDGAQLTRPALGGDAVDALVIGAGASGSVAAKHLAEAGFSVVCLEQGPWKSASDYPGEKREFELLADTEGNANPNVRRWDEDYPCETTASDVDPVMYNAVGGSTIHFGAQWTRMRPSDFKIRTLEGVGDDWPVTYEEMLPHYERMDLEIGVSGIAGDPAYPPGAAPPLPVLPIGKIGRTAALGMNKLGWHWWPAGHAIPSREYNGRPPCARRGTCMFGCNEGAKGSTDLSLWPDAIKAGAKLITGARVREVLVNDQGLATGASWVDRDGQEHVQEAAVVVVGANGVGTPRLLLNSRSAKFPDGLANSSGMVGKRLMLHPYMSVLGIYEDELDSWLGPWGTPLLSLQFADTDPARGFPRGAQWDVMPLGGPIFALERYVDRPFAERFGPNVHELVKRTLGHAFDWGIGIEDMPLDRNTVTIDPGLTDSDGIPAPKITYEIDDDARKNLAWMLEKAREAHAAAGATDTVVTDWTDWGWHLLGTARMGEDPASSVVNRWGQTHDVPNLFIFDGSVFPTSGPQPPTATIAANAARCAAHLIEQAGNQQAPA